ncbi:MAG: hypothetical protein AAGN15_03400 [Cyanobacteria bacterium J06581_3]
MGASNLELDTTQKLECCEKNSRLYDALNLWLGQGENWAHLAHLTTCLWLVAALIQTGEINLTKWAKYMPCRGQYAQSRQGRIRRWLGSSGWNLQKS